MATNLAIDDKLIIEAQQLGHHKSKKDTVNEALKEYIQKRKQKKIIKLFGKIDFNAGFNYKNFRNR